MKGIHVTIDGVAYPCRPTMGAMLRFKHETGKEVTEINGDSLSDVCAYLWCCVVSACKKDGKAFDMSLMDFADSITGEDIQQWSERLNEEATASNEDSDGAKKKNPVK